MRQGLSRLIGPGRPCVFCDRRYRLHRADCATRKRPIEPPAKKCPTCEGTGCVEDDYRIGQMIRRIREEKGVTLRALARAMKISAPYLCDLEHGRRRWGFRVKEAKDILEK